MNIKDIIDEINEGLPKIPSPLRDFDYEYPCLHELFDQQLINDGICKTIEEARHKSRYLSCPCPKCNINY